MQARVNATAVLLAASFAAGAALAQDAQLGRNLAATCANCHGSNGAARGDAKVLAGMPVPALVGLMAAYKGGAVSGTIMNQIAKGYSEEQVALIAAFFAAQQPRK